MCFGSILNFATLFASHSPKLSSSNRQIMKLHFENPCLKRQMAHLNNARVLLLLTQQSMRNKYDLFIRLWLLVKRGGKLCFCKNRRNSCQIKTDPKAKNNLPWTARRLTSFLIRAAARDYFGCGLIYFLISCDNFGFSFMVWHKISVSVMQQRIFDLAVWSNFWTIFEINLNQYSVSRNWSMGYYYFFKICFIVCFYLCMYQRIFSIDYISNY